MILNADSYKQAQGVIFTCKVKKVLHPLIFFNNDKPVQQVSSQKHLGFILTFLY